MDRHDHGAEVQAAHGCRLKIPATSIVIGGDAANSETYLLCGYHRSGAPNAAVARAALIVTVPIPDDVPSIEADGRLSGGDDLVGFILDV
jgi:hypothetical protein